MGRRIGIVGPRRIRQGLGPFLAAFAERAGAEVVACTGRDPTSAAAGARELELRLGHPVEPFPDVASMLESAELDAVLIASPIESHEAALELACLHERHVLCEKPLLPPLPGSGRRAREYAERFAKAGCWLFENVQWPKTLDAFFALYPERRGAPVREFTMHLCPASTGVRQLIDSLSHPLSLLQALTGSEESRVEAIRVRPVSAEAHQVSFVYVHADGAVDCRIELRRSTSRPRPAGFAVDGAAIEREIDPDGYRFFLRAGERKVSLPDPLGTWVGDFVAALDRDPRFAAEIVNRQAMLETLISAASGQGVGP